MGGPKEHGSSARHTSQDRLRLIKLRRTGGAMNGKTISASVGLGGKNASSDVATVQYLLNCVPVSAGGPAKELVIDGFAGVLTQKAISQFQQVQFGKSDGRVDPGQSGGKTIAVLNKYDPLPFSPPVVVPSVKSKWMTPKVEGKLATPKVEMPGLHTPKVEIVFTHPKMGK
jgi:peptidoglycan hydrolase-like protein with peptidoglycan-binding domain